VVARDALGGLGLVGTGGAGRGVATADGGSLGAYLWARRAAIGASAVRHLLLVAIALLAAVVVAGPPRRRPPRGGGVARAGVVAEPVIGALGVLQTIPSVALLAFMIPLFGVGAVPALVALWAYALYPIARNTYIGVRDADRDAVEAAEALGMTPAQRLLQVR